MWNGPYGGMMGGYGYGWGWSPFHGVIWLVIAAVVIALVVWLVRSSTHAGTRTIAERRSAGLELLEERYARGEINREEYLQKKRDILA